MPSDSETNIVHALCLRNTRSYDIIDYILPLQRLGDATVLDKTALSRFTSYLTDRSQQVLVKQTFSREIPLLCLVPHDSVFGFLPPSLCTRQLLIWHFEPSQPQRITSGLTHKTTRHSHTEICCRLSFCFLAEDSEHYSCLPKDHEAALSAVNNIGCRCLEIKNWMRLNE